MVGDCARGAGQHPSIKDWETHLTTIFPEVRLKRYMEMRGADGGPSITALSALWVGLLYDRCGRSLLPPATGAPCLFKCWVAPAPGKGSRVEVALAVSKSISTGSLPYCCRHGELGEPCRGVFDASCRAMVECCVALLMPPTASARAGAIPAAQGEPGGGV